MIEAYLYHHLLLHQKDENVFRGEALNKGQLCTLDAGL